MYVTTPLIPSVRGKVIEVPVIPNKLLKEGELLFRVDPTPYQTEVTRLEASLEQAKQAVLGLDAAYKAAEASRIKPRPNGTEPNWNMSATAAVLKKAPLPAPMSTTVVSIISAPRPQ